MTYQVIARKWRPLQFESVIGQEHVTKTLVNAVRNGTIGHAFLFSGPRGVGKTTTARILAKALNCETGITPDPCNQCSSCKEINAGTSFDVFEIDAASNRGIDEIRELKEKARYAPAKLRFKVFIIDEVHMLTREAFNALLKTLEEPPPYVKFVLATTESHKIPDTILSRCQRYEFRLVGVKTLEAALRRICDAEGISISNQGLRLISRMGEGSVRDAESLLEQVIAFGGSTISDDEVALLTNSVGFGVLTEVMEALLTAQVEKVLHLLDRISEAGYNMTQVARSLAQVYRDVLVCAVTSRPAELLDHTAEELDELVRLSRLASPEKIQQQFHLLSNCEAALRQSSYPKFVLEMTFLKMARVGEFQNIADVVKGLAQLVKEGRIVLQPGVPVAPVTGVGGVASPSPAAPSVQEGPTRPPFPEADRTPSAPPAPPAPPPPSRDWAAAWQASGDSAKLTLFMEYLRERGDIRLSAMLDGVGVQGWGESVVVMYYPDPQPPIGLKDMLPQAERALSELLGRPAAISLQPRPENASIQTNAEVRSEQKRREEAELRAELLRNPLLRMGMKTLGVEGTSPDRIDIELASGVSDAGQDTGGGDE